MTLFLLGFISAIALMAILLIVYALKVYHRQEAHRQASTDAILAKLAVQPPHQTPSHEPPQGRTKGIH